jgi:hypothetical protein
MIKLLLIPIFLLSTKIFCQEINLPETIIQIGEELAADESDPEAAATYIEKLYELAEYPVEVNSTNEDEISRLFFLSDFQVKALADYAHASGRIITVYEIAGIPGFDKETAEMMMPFITLGFKGKTVPDSVNWKNSTIMNLSLRSGLDDSSYLGSGWKVLTKYKFISGGFSGGFTTEKDPGEKYLTGSPPLPDFLSANLAYKGGGLLRKLIIGDYSAHFGQGTNINTGIRRGLTLSAPGYMSASNEIKPYTSTDENNFFRGIAGELSYKNLDLILFYSKNYSDATLGSLSGNSKEIIETLYMAGIHNKSSLLSKKDAISELVLGGNLTYNFKNLRIGVSFSQNSFSFPVKPLSRSPEDIFDFEGRRNNAYTVFYNSLIKRILLYGELSLNNSHRSAFVQGLSFRPSDRLAVNFLFRSYDAGYFSIHAKGPGSGSATSNERGILGNFTFEAARHLFISGGSDIHYFSWLKYRCSSPSWGLRQEIRVRFLPTAKVTSEISYSHRLSMADDTETTGIPELKQVITRSIKASARYSIFDNFSTGTRIDYKIVDPSGSRGMLILQEFNYRFRSFPLTLWFRYCMFNTGDWDSRIYTFENDLLYSYSIPALSGVGSRSYIMVKWEIGDFAEVRIKYGVTSLDENQGTSGRKDEFKLQLKTWF